MTERVEGPLALKLEVLVVAEELVAEELVVEELAAEELAVEELLAEDVEVQQTECLSTISDSCWFLICFLDWLNKFKKYRVYVYCQHN